MIQDLLSLLVLVILELVLGIDNLIFVNIIIDNSHYKVRTKLRRVWAICGVIVRSLLLLCLSWLLSQKGKPIFTLFDKSFDLASIVMLSGGLFLIYKTVLEIHEKLEGESEHSHNNRQLSFSKAAFQIIIIDMVFSFDSVITAGGTAKVLWVMITAVIIAMIGMFYFSETIANFIHKRPTLKILALSFLVMIGFTLVVEGLNSHAAETLNLKNYVYFAMLFSFAVELLNLRIRKKEKHDIN
jgi:predicted tellurium resistance membrane protein TerC